MFHQSLKGDAYLHPDLEFWMHAIANGDHTILDVFDIFADVKMTIWTLTETLTAAHTRV